MADTPAFVRNGRLDILATNRLGRALYAPLFAADAPRPVNIARFKLLTPGGRDFFPDWETSLNTTVSLLRTEAGRAPHDSDLTGLIGELVTRSEEFRTAWAKHNVRLHHTGSKPFRHPEIGDIRLDFDAMDLPAQPGLTLTVYSAEPGTRDHDALRHRPPPALAPRRCGATGTRQIRHARWPAYNGPGSWSWRGRSCMVGVSPAAIAELAGLLAPGRSQR